MDGCSYFPDQDAREKRSNGQEHVLLNEIDTDEEASVIEETAECIKQLEEKLNFLEQQIRGNRKKGSEFISKVQEANAEEGKSISSNADDYTDISSSSSLSSSSTSVSASASATPALEVKAKVSEKEVLVRIHSEVNNHLLPSILREMANLGLSPFTATLMPFGLAAMVITIIAQMDDEFCMTAKDLTKHLRQAALQHFLSRSLK